MQEKLSHRTNKERTEFTRSALVSAARDLFINKGYAETGTPEIVSTAKVTRGALYHHFADKLALFRAVVEGEAYAVSAEIDKTTTDHDSAIEALMAGTDAYFEAMSEPGRADLLLVDGPAVLGHDEMMLIDQASGGEQLRLGLGTALERHELSKDQLLAMTEILSAAFDRAALAIARGGSSKNYKAAIRSILQGLI